MTATNDNPIKRPEDDTIGRGVVAKTIADELRHVDVSEGCVVAIMGPWGFGKTSLVNLVQHELKDNAGLAILDFNPWMFSGAEQLVESFFVELAAQLRLKEGHLGKIAGEVEAYGELLSPLSLLPFVGGWFERLKNTGGAFKKFQERRKESVTARRAKLAQKLAELERPIIVVLDDIDRLTTAEIRDIFKLVRLTASFPNVIYLMAFDRKRVESALAETNIDGRSYLEKIVQVAYDIPAVPESVLLTQFARTLQDVIDSVGDVELFNENAWPDVLAEVIWPLIKNMRDARRYVASVRGAVSALKEEVELVDILAMEAVRIFLPDAFSSIAAAPNVLTRTSDDIFGDRSRQDAADKAVVDDIIAAAAPHEDVVRALMERVLPAGGRHVGTRVHYGNDSVKRWLRSRRVAHISVLQRYLERVTNDQLISFTDAERAFRVMADESAFDELLRSVESRRAEDVIAALETYEGEYPVGAVPVAMTVLLNILPDLPKREQRGFWSMDTRLVVARVVLRLLNRLGDPVEVARITGEVLARIHSLSSKLELVKMVGHEESVGHKLVTEAAAKQFEADLMGAIQAATPTELANEKELLRLLLWAQNRLPDGEAILGDINEPALNKALLVDARRDARIQTSGNRAVHRELRLAWDVLIRLYGGEERLRQAIDEIRGTATTDPSLSENIELAAKYLSGWRPKDF